MTIRIKSQPSRRAQKGHKRSDMRQVRNVPKLRELQLYVAAAGLCQMPSCRENVLVHVPTLTPINLGEKAHIISFERAGPRGYHPSRPIDIHNTANLMLLCPSCHKLVDENAGEYPVGKLLRYKGDHERLVREFQDGLHAEIMHTTVIRFIAPIGSKPAEIPSEHIRRAIFPNRQQGDIFDISLADSHSLPEDEIYTFGNSLIAQRIGHFLDGQRHDKPSQHLSIFGLGPIPLLVALGSAIGRDLPVRIFNRHSTTDDWAWRKRVPAGDFRTKRIRKGTNTDLVALLVSCSGRVQPNRLPSSIDQRFSIYAIEPIGEMPSKEIVRTERTLEHFRSSYEQFRAQIRDQHSLASHIHVFAAVPPAVAITLGRDLISKVDPILAIYDWRRDHYVKAFEVNQP